MQQLAADGVEAYADHVEGYIRSKLVAWGAPRENIFFVSFEVGRAYMDNWAPVVPPPPVEVQVIALQVRSRTSRLGFANFEFLMMSGRHVSALSVSMPLSAAVPKLRAQLGVGPTCNLRRLPVHLRIDR